MALQKESVRSTSHFMAVNGTHMTCVTNYWKGICIVVRHMYCNVLCREPRNEKCLIKGLMSMRQSDDVTLLLNLVAEPEIAIM